MMKTIALFFVFALVYCDDGFLDELDDSPKVDFANSINLGNRTTNDTMVYENLAMVWPSIFPRRVATINRSWSGSKIISKLEAKALSPFGSASLVSGGPGFNATSIDIRSHIFFPALFWIKIFAV